MKKIAFILPYFGKFPKFFNLWIESCALNPSIDWLIFTDDRTSFNFPPNIHVRYTEFNALKEKIQRVFDFPICLPSPYKLCDFRAAYGIIFREELRDYDFWGYCDCDLVFGNIRKFITEEVLSNYDRILANGHFTLIRNKEPFTSLFKEKIPECRFYKDVFSSPLSFAFDEWGGTSNIWAKIFPHRFFRFGSPLKEHLHDDLHIGKKHFVSTKKAPQEDLGFVWKKEDGNAVLLRVFRGGSEESLYVHFQKRKMVFSGNAESQEFVGGGIYLFPIRFFRIFRNLKQMNKCATDFAKDASFISDIGFCAPKI